MGLRCLRQLVQRHLGSLRLLSRPLSPRCYVTLADKNANTLAFLLSEPFRVRASVFQIKIKHPLRVLYFYLGRTMGLEPTTTGTTNRGSTN